MIKTRFKKAYKNNGHTSYPEAIKKSGTYLIADKNNKIVYVGYSKTQLYKTIYRHFQSWNDPTQKRATFPKWYKVRIVLTTPARAKKLEQALIIKYKPRGNDIGKKTDPTPQTDEEYKKYISTFVTPFDEVPF